MTAELQTLEAISDKQLIGVLVASHGHVDLAAERLKVTSASIVERLPSLSYDELTAAVKAYRLLKALDAFTVMNDVIFKTLEELTPNERSKFFIQYMDRFQTMVEPPVQGGSGQAGSQTNVQFNLGTPEAQSDAREALGRRLIDITSERSVRDVQAANDAGESPAPQLSDPPRNSDAFVRLGIDGTARAIRALGPVDDLAASDG